MKNLLQSTTQLAQAIWEHYVTPQLASGAYVAVDATCGRGNDTVWLAERCARVYAFDIQPEAIAATRKALQAAGVCSIREISHAAGVGDASAAAPAVTLIEDSHANLGTYIREPIGLIVLNLGYLPGGDKDRTTTAASTLTALQAAADRLAVGGLLSVTMYWGHEAGKAEREAVLSWAAKLDRSIYHCVHTDMLNQPNCPPEILFVTRKR